MTSELPPPDPGDAQTAGRTSARHTGPNYRLRRLAVGGGVVALLIAGFAVAAVMITRGDEDGSAAAAPTWNAVVEVARATGDVRVLDTDGEEIELIAGTGRATDAHTHRSRVAVVGPGRVTITDTQGGSVTDVEVPAGYDVQRVTSRRSLTLLAAPTPSGNLVIVDGDEGEVLDVAELAGQSSPMLLRGSVRADPAGRNFAIGDGRNFQTVVVRFGEPEATFFPGVPLAVSADLVVTATNVGSSAEVGLFAADGERLAAVTTDRPVGGTLDGERFVYVTEAGALLAVASGANSPERLGAVPVPTGDAVDLVAPSLDGERLVVAGQRFTAVVDLEGEVVYHGSSAVDRDQTAPWATWRCLPVGGGDSFNALVELETGEVVADLTGGRVDDVSVDGCAVRLTGGEPAIDRIVTPDATYDIPATARTVLMAPDGTAVVLLDAGGNATLRPITDRSGDDGGGNESGSEGDGNEDVVLGVLRGFVAFVDR